MSNSGENVQALHKILDFLRFASVFILFIHFYQCCFTGLQAWHLTAPVVDRIIYNLSRGMPWLAGPDSAKGLCLGVLSLSLLGNKGKKDEKLTLRPVLFYVFVGCLLFFFSTILLDLPTEPTHVAAVYITVTSIGFLSILSGGSKLSRLLRSTLGKDTFNDLAETFEQEERLLTNEYSVNLPTRYQLKGKVRRGWINLISPFRALLVAGTPGS